jgi:NodT family efflux transporter outer membrane factor (OMF) lipoprotein
MNRSADSWAALAAAALLTGCAAFGPPRTPPMAPPGQYAAEALPAALAPGSEAPQQLTPGAPPIPEWWHVYQSPALDALVAEALAQNPSLAASRNSLEAAREQVRETVGDNLFPHIDVGLDGSRQRALGVPVLPQQTLLYNVFAAQAQASWTIDFFGASVLADRAQLGQVRAQEFEYAATRRALAANVVLTAITTASLQAQLECLQQWTQFAEQHAAQTRERYSLGSASQLEMLSDQSAAAVAARALPPLRRQLLAARHAEAVLLGRTPDQAPAPMTLESLQLPEELPVSVPSELLHQRPDIRAAEAAVRASADAAGAATAAMYPSLRLTADLGRGGFDWSTFTSPAGAIWGVGASLTQPIFHGGALRARARAYGDTYDAAVAQYRHTVLGAFQSVADTLVALQEDGSELEQAHRAAAALDGMQQILQARFEAGSVPMSQVLAVREQYQDAQVRYVMARAARLSDSAALLDAMGDPAAP